MTHTALLLVDIQNDFIPTGALPVPDGDGIIPVVNTIGANYDLVVASQDWHPPNHHSFATEHPGKKPFDTIELHGLQQTLWSVHCVQGSAGADFPGSLDTHPITAIFRKGIRRKWTAKARFTTTATAIRPDSPPFSAAMKSLIWISRASRRISASPTRLSTRSAKGFA